MENEQYKKRMTPENVFFCRCENYKGEQWFDISLNGAGYPSIRETRMMLASLNKLIEKLEGMGQLRIDKVNKQIEEENYEKRKSIKRSRIRAK